jgi:F-type H+-transporting ATPase subunit c
MKKLLLVLALLLLSFTVSGAALAAESSESGVGAKAGIAIAAGLAIGLAAFGAALGQGRMAAAAMESIGRNPNAAPRIQLPMILGLAFIEALAIYALIIAFALQGKV